jgi:sugar O-acyltransferase (sialic acid O-acetyltransferase NeuD family)
LSSSVVLFGAGSPILVEIEETCLRLGISIAAVVRNTPDPAPAYRTPTIPATGLTASLLALPMAFPLFMPANRRAAWSQAAALGARHYASLVDPTAILPSRLGSGEGLYINAGAVIGSSSRFGRFVFVNRAAAVGHHVELGDFVSVGPGAIVGGNASIAEGAMVGAGAVVRSGLAIGANAMIGVGAVVMRDVPASAVMLGNPARLVRRDVPDLDRLAPDTD